MMDHTHTRGMETKSLLVRAVSDPEVMLVAMLFHTNCLMYRAVIAIMVTAIPS